MSWLTGWTYRKSVTLSRASGAVTDYQMKVAVGESAGSSNFDAHLESMGLSSFDDLRFTNADGTTLLEYWIESISGTTPNQTAIVWIKFDSIGVDDTTFYAYYGNSEATNASSGDNTFVFFDDFEFLDTVNKWTVPSGSPWVTTDAGLTVLQVSSDSPENDIVVSKSTWEPGYAVRSKVKSDHYNSISYIECFGFLDIATQTYYGMFLQICHITEGLQGIAIIYDGNYHGTALEANWTANYYHIIDVLYLGSLSNKIYVDGVLIVHDTTHNVTATGKNIYYQSAHANAKIRSDWVLVRKIVSTEPTWGTWGEQEQGGTIYNRSCLSSFNISLHNLFSIIPHGPQSLNRSCSSAFSFNDIGAAARSAKEFDKSSRVGLVFRAHTRIWKPYALAHLSFNATEKRFTYSAKPGRES